MGSFFDKVFPFFVGKRTEITVVVTALANLLTTVVPAAAPVVATLNTIAPYLVGLFAAARAGRQ